MNLHIFCCTVLVVWVGTTNADYSCTFSSDCPNSDYYVCDNAICKCKYGNKTSGNISFCRECFKSRSFRCPEYAYCEESRCKCKYGEAVTNSSTKTCLECKLNDDCPKNADCLSNTCVCVYKGGMLSTHGKLQSCPNDCGSNDDCPDYYICKRSKCECEYGLSYSSDGSEGPCSTNVATIVSIVVGIAFFSGVIIVVICARRRSIAREMAAKTWVYPPPAAENMPGPSRSSPDAFPKQRTFQSLESFYSEEDSSNHECVPGITRSYPGAYPVRQPPTPETTRVFQEVITNPEFTSGTSRAYPHYFSEPQLVSSTHPSQDKEFTKLPGNRPVTEPSFVDIHPHQLLRQTEKPPSVEEIKNPECMSKIDLSYLGDYPEQQSFQPEESTSNDEGFTNPGYIPGLNPLCPETLPNELVSPSLPEKPPSPGEGFTNPGYMPI